jgi:hypothetical protein
LREEAWGKAKVCPVPHGEVANPQEDLIMFCPMAPVTDVELNGGGTPRSKKHNYQKSDPQIHLLATT